jgi:hypothetical protein
MSQIGHRHHAIDAVPFTIMGAPPVVSTARQVHEHAEREFIREGQNSGAAAAQGIEAFVQQIGEIRDADEPVGRR